MTNKQEIATDQATPLHDENGRFAKGNKPPTGFHTNPERRNPGGWSKRDSLRYKIEQASYLDNDELQAIVDDPKEATLLRKFAEATLKADWRMIKEISEMLYGKPKESVEHTSTDGTMPIVRIIDERPRTPDTK